MLRDGGVDLYTLTERDPIAETALQYAAIVKTGFDDQGGQFVNPNSTPRPSDTPSPASQKSSSPS